MIRTIIQIDEEKCNGCGICANACHEGAIEIVNGKAKLVRDSYCDGFGDCLPTCPTSAISFVEREAEAYDEEAVKVRMEQRAQGQGTAASAQGQAAHATTHGKAAPAAHTQGEAAPVSAPAPAFAGLLAHSHASGGCPGSAMRTFNRESVPATEGVVPANAAATVPSQLANWPVQIKLAPTQAPYFDGANLLIASDCCAFSYGNFHADFIRNKVCLIGCPKLDGTDYSEKLTEIIATNNIKSVTITRMEVPCCGGLENMAKKALQDSGKFIPWQVTTFSLDGRILD
ncbi:MAG: 4Fe-4S binding protein [Eggerthellaceae bacterium]|nr:4Fe-4S binding protein [Eggerthellaceae bacterium]